MRTNLERALAELEQHRARGLAEAAPLLESYRLPHEFTHENMEEARWRASHRYGVQLAEHDKLHALSMLALSIERAAVHLAHVGRPEAPGAWECACEEINLCVPPGERRAHWLRNDLPDPAAIDA